MKQLIRYTALIVNASCLLSLIFYFWLPVSVQTVAGLLILTAPIVNIAAFWRTKGHGVAKPVNYIMMLLSLMMVALIPFGQETVSQFTYYVGMLCWIAPIVNLGALSKSTEAHAQQEQHEKEASGHVVDSTSKPDDLRWAKQDTREEAGRHSSVCEIDDKVKKTVVSDLPETKCSKDGIGATIALGMNRESSIESTTTEGSTKNQMRINSIPLEQFAKSKRLPDGIETRTCQCQISADGRHAIVGRSTVSGSSNMGSFRLPIHDTELPSLALLDLERMESIQKSYCELSNFTLVATAKGGIAASLAFRHLSIIDAENGKKSDYTEETWSSATVDGLRTVALSSDGALVAHFDSDSSLIVRDLTTGEELAQVAVSCKKTAGVKFSRSGRYVVIYTKGTSPANEEANQLIVKEISNADAGCYSYDLKSIRLNKFWVDDNAESVVTLNNKGILQKYRLCKKLDHKFQKGELRKGKASLVVEVDACGEGRELAVNREATIAITYGWNASRYPQKSHTTIRIWELEGGQHLRYLEMEKPINFISNLSDNGRFLVGTSDGYLHHYQLGKPELRMV